MIVKMLTCQNCQQEQLDDAYQTVINKGDPDRWVQVKICPNCKHGNYWDNICGMPNYKYTEVDNDKVMELIKCKR